MHGFRFFKSLSLLVASARGPKDPATREKNLWCPGLEEQALFVKSAIPCQALEASPD